MIHGEEERGINMELKNSGIKRDHLVINEVRIHF